MKASIVLLATLLVAVSAVAPLAMGGSIGIHQKYIVVFQDNVTETDRAAHMAQVRVENYASFSIGSFSGYSAVLSDVVLSQVRESDIVSYVEQDKVIDAWQACSQQKNADWGLDRIGERVLNLDGKYNYDADAGSSVTAYIIDTGILITHNELQGRAIWGANFVDDVNTDCNGHGTHVAGTVGGITYGVAKKTTLIAVKVLSCEGSGSNAGVIQGINWAASDAQKRKALAVANMSLGGPKSQASTDAVNAAVATGLFFAVAAGNSDLNACNFSPANAASAVCVGSTDVGGVENAQEDIRSYFSNWGTCVDIFAPGTDITSAWIGSDSAINTISGTSMATPHVCGVAALLRAQNPTASPLTINNLLDSWSTPNEIAFTCDGSTKTQCEQSPNKLLYSACS